VSEQSKQTPLVDLLRLVPADFRCEWESDWAEDGRCIGHSRGPVGRHCHMAANEIERLNAHLATVQKQADDMVAKHSVLTDNVKACNSVINENARARQRLESVIGEYKAEVAFLRGQLEA